MAALLQECSKWPLPVIEFDLKSGQLRAFLAIIIISGTS
jgi:hypothetical protein